MNVSYMQTENIMKIYRHIFLTVRYEF